MITGNILQFSDLFHMRYIIFLRPHNTLWSQIKFTSWSVLASGTYVRMVLSIWVKGPFQFLFWTCGKSFWQIHVLDAGCQCVFGGRGGEEGLSQHSSAGGDGWSGESRVCTGGESSFPSFWSFRWLTGCCIFSPAPCHVNNQWSEIVY